MAHGTHDFEDDPRNEGILIWVNGELLPRERAVVSVFDSGFVLGDGVWEGLRIRAGHPAFLDRHLDRLFEGAKALMLDIGRSREELTEAVYATLRANDMTDGVHVRLMVTRGVKRTPYQDPRVTIGPATVVIIAEHKEPLPATVTDGITLFTTHVRRATPDTLDPKLNAHSKLNDITACIQAYTAGADEALMLDPHGFVADVQLDALLRRRRPEDAPRCGPPTGASRSPGSPAPTCWRSAAPTTSPRARRRSASPTSTRPRGVRHRHVRRRRARADRRRPDDRRRPARPGGRAPADAVPRARRRRRLGPRGAMSDDVRVAMWSGPRNISTAMMRAWENRPDTVVVDEPLYAAYLARTGVDHPVREEVLASQPTDTETAIGGLSAPLPPGRRVHYTKHMAHHVFRDTDLEWTLGFRNVLLIRDPSEVVASYVRRASRVSPTTSGCRSRRG
jgi:hypothetical protein